MPITCRFLGCGRASLSLAAEYLVERYSDGVSLDLSTALVVLPGGRAGRRLLEILVDQAASRGLILTPPQIETVGRIPERLYRPRRPLANDLVQQLAWVHVLRQADPQELRQVFAALPGDDPVRWLEYGRLLWRLHTELAADGLNFEDVARRGEDLELFTERPRWTVLRRLQQSYLGLLDALDLWDVQTARLVAVQQGECRADRDLILVGTVDMTITLRRMLDQVADRVTALIFAPPEWSDRFDEHGCLVPSAWQTVEIPVGEQQVHVVDGPPEQADRVGRCLAEFGGSFRPDEVTIGLADEMLAPLVERQLQQCGIAARSAAGLPLPRTGPLRLLAAVEAYLRTGGYAEFAALVRHPDVSAMLQRGGARGGWLNQLDQYYNDHLQARLGGIWLGGDRAETVRAIYGMVQRWLQACHGPAKLLTRWAEAVRGLLLAVYGHRSWSREEPAERVLLRALEQIQAVLSEHAEAIPPLLLPSLSGADALRLLIDQLQSAAVAPPPDPAAVELLGWLELPLDDAPALIVCGVNEGYVPSSLNADPFLPDTLRSRLGLQDNVRRYARDAYALSVLLATRERVELIAARRNGEGDPLVPSRLLFAADAQTLARRALRFFSPPTPLHGLPPLAGGLIAARQTPDFEVPRPLPLETPIGELRVTAFRDYLACPYRFYLRHVLRLQTISDAAQELDGAAFGNLLHDVMRDFGSGPSRDSCDPEEIRAALDQALQAHAAEAFGDRPLATIGVQIEQLRQRLNAFAQVQARWAEQGWRIEYIEAPERDHAGSEFDVDGHPIVLRGRIDRIDVHRDTGERLILDYKSSDAARTPDAVHRRGGRWVDLQLPLYRHLAMSLGLQGPLRLGYILLPKDVGCVGFQFAEWTVGELEEADERAREVVRAIRLEVFWPPVCPPPDYSEDLGGICQDQVFDRPMLGEPLAAGQP